MRIARLWRFVGRLGEAQGHVGRRLDCIFCEDGARLGKGRRIWHGQPRADDRRIVAGHVGDGERHNPGGSCSGGEPTTLDGGEMLSHAIDFRNVGAALEERARYHLLVGKSDATRGQRQERRRAARDETDQQIVRTKPLDAIEQTLRRGATSGVGNGVTSLDDFDAVTRYGAPVTGDDHARESGRPMMLSAFAIAAAALPAPTTRVRPLGGAGRCKGNAFAGGRAPTVAAAHQA